MATTHDDGFHEIHLNGKQLVFLFMAVTVVSVVIFLCGVLVGRGVHAAAPGDAMAALATDTLPPAPDPVAAPSARGGAPVTANEPLSYPERLSGDRPVTEGLREGATPKAAERTPAAAPARERTTPPPPAPAKPAPAVERPASQAAAPARREPAASSAAKEPAGAGFAIQVAALRDKAEAESMARRLSGKGYSAYVVAPSSGAPSMYRVRVGKFTERRQADAVAARLQKEEQFKPWIVR